MVVSVVDTHDEDCAHGWWSNLHVGYQCPGLVDDDDRGDVKDGPEQQVRDRHMDEKDIELMGCPSAVERGGDESGRKRLVDGKCRGRQEEVFDLLWTGGLLEVERERVVRK